MILTDQTQQINHQTTRLFAVIAHDVRGPIEIMRSALSHMKEEKTSISHEDINFLVDRFEQQLDSVSTMLNSLLLWAKEQQYGLTIQPIEVFLSNEVELSCQLLGSFAAQKEILLKNLISSEINIQTDKDILQVILRNLISNAIKFSYSGSEVVIECKTEIEAIIISVQDSGVGIKDSVIHLILNNEKVNSGYGTAKEKGLGLGLSITKEFIEKLGGEMSISSVLGEGTNMSFTPSL